MSTPAEYELRVARYFEERGYQVHVTSLTNDYGLDVLADNGKERVAVQAKMYGNTSRKVNRQMIMELHGVRDYFDCNRAVLATDGALQADAILVANKLGIEILFLDAEPTPRRSERDAQDLHDSQPTFDRIWQDHIMPLQGQTVTARSGRTNTLLTVDWSGVTRVTSTGQTGTIDIEVFRMSVRRLMENGAITRDEINQEHAKRASSGVVLILSQVPFFTIEYKPKMRLVYQGTST